MAISDRITSIEEHLKESYQELEGIGIDTTGVNNNLENIPKLLDGYWETLPKVTDEGTSITLDNTKEGKMKVLLKGNTYQDSTTGKNLIPFTNQDFTKNNVRYYAENGNLYLGGTSTGETSSVDSAFKTNFSFTLPAGTYTLSHKTGIIQLYLYKYEDNTSIIILPYSTASQTFTLTEETKLFIGFYVYQKTFTNENMEIMISTSGGDYEPYTNGASPNPDYPQEVHVVSGDNEVKVEGKNLFNESAKMGGYYFENNGTISSGGGARNCLFYLKCRPSTAYSFSYGSYQNMSIINISTTKEKPQAGVSVGSGSPITLANLKKENYVTPNDAEYIVIRFQSATNTDIANNPFSNFVTNFQVEQNTVATTYEAYTGTIYPINLPEGMFLGSIGDYQDRFFKAIEGDSVYDSLDSATKETLDTNEWYLEKKIGKVVLNGSETFNDYGNTATGLFKAYTIVYSGNSLGIANRDIILSNYFKVLSTISQSSTDIGIRITAYGFYFAMYNTTANSASDFRTWLGTHNTEVYYPMTTPTYTKIEGTLASQLEALNGSKSYTPQTNISQNNNDMASVLNATALSNGTVTPSLQGIQTLSLGHNVGLQTQEPIEEQAEEVEEQDEQSVVDTNTLENV